MNKKLSGIGVAALAAAVCGCATLKAEDVKIYSPAQLSQGEYQTVARLWVDSWRTVFRVPTYSSESDGIAALQDKAASLGANGLINVACYAGAGQLYQGRESFICYAKAIKVP